MRTGPGVGGGMGKEGQQGQLGLSGHTEDGSHIQTVQWLGITPSWPHSENQGGRRKRSIKSDLSRRALATASRVNSRN